MRYRPRLVALILMLALAPMLALPTARAQHAHEYAPLEEKAVNYRDWTFNSLADGTPVNLRRWVQGKRLVLVVYFASWCGNWRMEAPVVARLYEKYRQHGFDVIAVSEYAPTADVRSYFGPQSAPYTVVVESDAPSARDTTSHYRYRHAAGDARRWGSPWNIFLEPARLARQGEVLTERAWIVNGELVEEEVERFIRERLGLPHQAAPESASR